MSHVVVLVGVLDDPVLVYVAQHMVFSGRQVVWLDQNAMGVDLFCDATGWVHRKARWVLPHAQVRVVYNRMASLPYSQASSAQIMAFEQLLFLLDEIYPIVVNRPHLGLTNFSKLAQLVSIDLGALTAPDSQLQVYDGPKTQHWIYKSASQQRSIVSRVNAAYWQVIGAEPVLYQKYVSGDNVRVHVLDGRCYAVRVKTGAVDYRYSDQRHFQVTQLSETIAASCVNIAKQLQLVFCGIDLIDHQQQWCLLEINPSPGFNFFESQTNDQRLTQALIRFLVGCD